MNHLEELTGTKKKILEVAIELFSRKGYSDVSVRELTKEVGIKESSLYNHFKSKEAILEMIYLLFQQQNASAFPSVDILPELVKWISVEDFLWKGLENFKKTVEDPLHEKMWRILNIEQFKDQRARDIILNLYHGTIDFLEVAFKAFMNEKKIKEGNARTLAIQYQYPIFTMMTEYLLLKYDHKENGSVEQKMKEHLNFYMLVLNSDIELP